MAAGLGFKTFTTGEVLTAGDVNGYLMQGINVFTNSTARDAAITAPAEGQFAFTKDNNSLWYYDGAAWVASGATGDIEGVTAGVGISGGGTSGTVTVTNSMATAIDAKGDLVPGTGADTFARLAVGANNTVLTADSSTATGLKWATPAGGANWSLLNTGGTSLSGVATVTVSGISNAGQILIIHQNAKMATANGSVSLRINADTGTNYDYRTQVFVQPGTSYATSISSSTAQNNGDQVILGGQANSTGANAFVNGYALISGASTSGVKPVFMASGGADDGGTGFQAMRIGTAIYDSSTAVSSITFLTSNASNFTDGTIYVYTTA